VSEEQVSRKMITKLQQIAVYCCVMPFLTPLSLILIFVQMIGQIVPSGSLMEHLIRYSIFVFPSIGFAIGILAMSYCICNPSVGRELLDVRVPLAIGILLNGLVLSIVTYAFV
jgi:hypothetical protein